MRMPFGKFRGVEIGDIPDDYLKWLQTLGALREPLHSAVQAEWDSRFGRAQRNPGAPPAEVRTMAEEIVSCGYRQLAKLYHPDTGGDTRAMQLANAGAEWLRRLTRGKS